MVSLRKPAESNVANVSVNVYTNVSVTNTESNSVNTNTNSSNANSTCVCPPANSAEVITNSSNTNSYNANANLSVAKPTFDEQVMATYKTKCSGCHSPKAEKFFDPTKPDEVYLDAVLKGKKTSKPPMPGFEEKGLKPDEAKVLIDYMKSLRMGNK